MTSTESDTRKLSFSIDSILSPSDNKLRVRCATRYSPYATETSPTGRTEQTSPPVSYGTEALDARLREYAYSNDESKDDDDYEEMESPRPATSPSHNERQSKSPDGGADLKPKSKKKTRTVFSRQQVFYLEAAFDAKRYLSSAERSEIASALSLTETQIKVWFQNRRNKWKSQLSGDGSQSPNQETQPIVFPPFLCGGLTQGGHNGLPSFPFFRQPMYF